MSLMEQAGTILKKAGTFLWEKGKKTSEHLGDIYTLRPSFRLQEKQQAFMQGNQQKWLAFQAEAQRENRGIQVALQERQLRTQAELQKRQQAFQVALQERNYQLMGQL